MTTPFEAGRAIGNNISQGIRGARDTVAIQDILAEAQQMNNSPEAQQNAIQQILSKVSQSRQPNVMQLLQNQGQARQQQQSNQAFSNITGYSPEQIQGLSPKEREIVLSNQLKAQAKPAFTVNKPMLNTAFNRAEQILKGGYTGKTIKSFGKTGRQERAELNNLSEIFISNLIPLINPRGTMSKERFNYIKNLTPQGHDTDETIRGKLDSLRTIFEMNPDQLSSLENMPDNQFKMAIKSGIVSQQSQQNISDDQIDALLQQTGGNVDEAINILQNMQNQ